MPVYLIAAGDYAVKIGKANDPKGRLSDLQVGNHEALRLLRVFEGDEAEEALLHLRFAHLHKRGDWFAFSREMLGDVGLVEIEIAPLLLPPPPAPVEPEAPIGPRLVFLRKSRNLTQVRVANELGIARSTLASIEACGDMPGRSLLMSLARYYGLTADELCGAA